MANLEILDFNGRCIAREMSKAKGSVGHRSRTIAAPAAAKQAFPKLGK